MFDLKKTLTNAHRLFIFGAGGEGRQLLKKFHRMGLRPVCFIDNNQSLHTTKIAGVEIRPAINLLTEKQSGDLVCIASDWAKDIAKQLRSLGISNYLDLTHWSTGRYDGLTPSLIRREKAKIQKALNLFADEASKTVFSKMLEYRFQLDPLEVVVSPFRQYFHPLVKPEKGETIYDVGAWHGDTAVQFSRAVSGKCRIIAFEPDSVNFEQLKTNVRSYPNVFPVKMGIWYQKETLRVNNNYESSMMYVLGKTGRQKVLAQSLDWFAQITSLSPNLIKMDIEGTEMQGLRGSKNLLKRVAPKLQIAIYDGVESLWEIPLLINEYNPRYQLYLGHHSQSITDTVLYAKA